MENRPPESKNVESAAETGERFAKELLLWNRKKNKRQMPWKGEKDPYKIWLSEIILQQTRVEQGLKYYENFISAFPNVEALAAAPEAQVFKLWEGLGYYSRCRNLIATAQFITKDLRGVFPRKYESILQLKGVGPYTAAAIASFAYNFPYAVLDGNVFRVLSRIFNDDTPIDSTQGKKKFSALTQAILPKTKAGEYNQAIMDFGATLCKPYPECAACFFTKHCGAYRHARQDVLPVKEKTVKVRKRWLNYLVVQHRDSFLIRQRTGKDIWQQLHEFLLIETEKPSSEEHLLKLFHQQYGDTTAQFLNSHSASQKLSHQVIDFQLVQVKIDKKINVPGMTWVKRAELSAIAFPRTLQQFIADVLK